MDKLVRQSFTPVLDTDQYASGDVLFVTTAVLGAIRHPDGKGVLRAITVRDKDDQGVAIIVYFLRANAALGTINSPASISDANADYITGWVDVAAASYDDLGGVKVAQETDLYVPLQAAAGGRTLYVAAITSGGTPTHTASGITIDLWIEPEL